MKTKSDIIGKHLSGNCSPEENTWVQEQLTSSADFRSEYESFSQVWELTNRLDHNSSSTDESWQIFKAKVEAPQKGIGFDWLKVAASIVLLAAFSVIIYKLVPQGERMTAQATVEQIELVDGSTIQLNQHSSLQTSARFDQKNRNLSLEGEAYFEVAKADHDFVLALNGGTLRVTGTRFNVFNPVESDFVAVDLYEGSIELMMNGETRKVEAGTHIEWNGEWYSSALKTSQPSWFDSEEIYCRNESLLQIMLEIEKHYGVKFDLPRKKLKERYTVSLPKTDLDACVALIANITQLPMQLEGDQISLK